MADTDAGNDDEGHGVRLHEDEVTTPGQDQPRTFAYLESAPAVVIVPVTATGAVVLIRQFRYACATALVEVPAGTRGDQGDAALEEVARSELRQEIGATCGTVQVLATFFESPGHSTQRSTAVIAWETALTQAPQREPGEDIEVWTVPAAEALARARRGEVEAAPCALALFLAEPHLRARGFL